MQVLTIPTRPLTKPSSQQRKRALNEALVGWGFISVPMTLFLVLSVGIFFYAIYISTYRWGILGPRGFPKTVIRPTPARPPALPCSER